MWTRVGLSCVVTVALVAVAAAKPRPPDLVVTQPIIEVLDPAGTVSAKTVQEGLAKIAPELARCGVEQKWTGDALVWLVTDWRGKVMKAEVAVGKTAVERCLTLGLKRLVVPKAHSRATTMMRLRVAPPEPPADEQLK